MRDASTKANFKTGTTRLDEANSDAKSTRDSLDVVEIRKMLNDEELVNLAQDGLVQ